MKSVSRLVLIKQAVKFEASQTGRTMWLTQELVYQFACRSKYMAVTHCHH